MLIIRYLDMNSVETLQNALFAYKHGICGLKECVDWAVARLSENENEGDADIILLAGSSNDSEAKCLAQNIVHRYLQPDALQEEVLAGRLLVRLHDSYRAGTISIVELEPIIDALYRNLGYPNWLVMLGRNCEYATDIEPFVKPFEDEFEYISALWKQSKSIDDFHKKYDRQISNTHDANYC